MVLQDPGAEAAAAGEAPADEAMAAAVARLEAAFRESHGRMRGTPLCNAALQVEALGFRPHEGHFVGVLVAPWFMNLMVLPGPGEDWSDLKPGEKEMLAFTSGTYEFVHNAKDGLGGYKACSLFSPMGEFPSQLAAADVAREVMPALFDERNRAEDTDRAGEIRRLREVELAAAAAAEDRDVAPARPGPPVTGGAAEDAGPAAPPSRRTLITGGLSGRAGA